MPKLEAPVVEFIGTGSSSRDQVRHKDICCAFGIFASSLELVEAANIKKSPLTL